MSARARYPWLDAIRSLAIYLMVIFHLSYDLDLFGHVEIDFQNNVFWLWFPCVIVFLFLLSVGASLRVAHHPDRRWPAFRVRWFKIFLSALAISGFTYFAFPNSWIYFGTLHNIAINSLLCLPFLARPRLAIGCCIAIIALDILGMPWPWIELSHSSMDYIPPFPWLAWVLLGIYLHHRQWHKLPFPSAKIWHALTWPGRHSLVIYLSHQGILYGLVWAYTLLTKS